MMKSTTIKKRPGRKPLPPEERKVKVILYLKPAEAALIEQRGGSAWVRQVIFGDGGR
jgi:hypothetical protein